MAPLLAKQLDFDWIDLDGRIELAAGAPVATVLTTRGEPAFRDLEALALEEALRGAESERGLVIACGAGALGRESNRALLRRSAFVVWLQVTPEVASERLEGPERAKRPLLGGQPGMEPLRALWEARRALYEAAADQKVETVDRTALEVARSIHALWVRRQGWGSSES